MNSVVFDIQYDKDNHIIVNHRKLHGRKPPLSNTIPEMQH